MAHIGPSDARLCGESALLSCDLCVTFTLILRMESRRLNSIRSYFQVILEGSSRTAGVLMWGGWHSSWGAPVLTADGGFSDPDLSGPLFRPSHPLIHPEIPMLVSLSRPILSSFGSLGAQCFIM